jgi:hypothetical protein
MSSEDFQQQGGSEAPEDEASAESSSESGGEEDEDEELPQQQQPLVQPKRPLSSRVRVVQAGRLKPPLAPKQQPKEPAAPAKRSFLTLAVSARESYQMQLSHHCSDWTAAAAADSGLQCRLITWLAHTGCLRRRCCCVVVS